MALGARCGWLGLLVWLNGCGGAGDSAPVTTGGGDPGSSGGRDAGGGSDAAADADAGMAVKCGTATCTGGQLCVHPPTSVGGPPPQCLPATDAGACPAGTQFEPSCA